jgi:hypothetical protein
MDAVGLGAVFLFALLAPAIVTNPGPIAPILASPQVVLLSLGSAAGVGGLLSLTGEAMWQFFFPYVPGNGIEKFTGARRPDFRLDAALTLGRRWDVTAGLGWSDGERALIAAEFAYYAEAPEPVREWTRRRHIRFSLTLSAVAAIVLGIVCGAFLVEHWNPLAIAIEIAFSLIAVATYVLARRQRLTAQRMEQYFFRLRAAGILKTPEADAAPAV